jgi:hypothetical protein
MIMIIVTPGHRDDLLKNNLDWKKKNNIWHLVLLGENI